MGPTVPLQLGRYSTKNPGTFSHATSDKRGGPVAATALGATGLCRPWGASRRILQYPQYSTFSGPSIPHLVPTDRHPSCLAQAASRSQMAPHGHPCCSQPLPPEMLCSFCHPGLGHSGSFPWGPAPVTPSCQAPKRPPRCPIPSSQPLRPSPTWPSFPGPLNRLSWMPGEGSLISCSSHDL